jgi:hypothetical protein
MGFRVKKRPSPLQSALAGFGQGIAQGGQMVLQKIIEREMNKEAISAEQEQADAKLRKEMLEAREKYPVGWEHIFNPKDVARVWADRSMPAMQEKEGKSDVELRAEIAKSIKDVGLPTTRAIYGDEVVAKNFPQGRFPKEDVKEKDYSSGKAELYRKRIADARAKQNPVEQLRAETNLIELRTGKTVYNSVADLEKADPRFKSIQVNPPLDREQYIKDKIRENPELFNFVIHDEPFRLPDQIEMLIQMLSR